MKIIHNVLSQDTIDLIRKEIHLKFQLECWKINVMHWKDILTKKFSGRVYSSYVSDELRNKIVSDIKVHILPYENLKNLHIQHYIWDVNSGINMHNDGSRSFGATIYMNEDWNINDGGLFVYIDSLTKEKQVIVPEFNKMIVNDAKIEHMVTHISPHASTFRVTIQIFG